MIYHKIKFNYKKLLLYIVAFFVIYESGTIPSIVSINDLFIDKLLLFISVGIFSFLALKKRRNCECLFLWLLLFSCFVFINIINSPETTFNLIYRLGIYIMIYLLLLYTFSKNIDFDILICRVIVFFAITSLLIYCLVHFLGIQLPYSYFYLENGGLRYISYFGIYFEQGYANTQFGFSFYRMTGPFWEPGVYQIFLNYALYRFLFKEKGNRIIIAILLIDLFLTMSAAGWLCTICMLALIIVRTPRLSKKNKFFILVLMIIVGLFACYYVLSIKFAETYSNGGSAFIRINDFLLALQLFIENPIFGTGFGNTRAFELRNFFNNTNTLGSSNGLMTICYTTGIIGMIFVLYPFVMRLIKLRDKDRIVNYFYFFMIMFFNFVEPVYYFPFMMYLLAKEYLLVVKKFKSY